MRAVGRKDTAPEKLVRSFLHSMGFRFSLNRKDLPGSPDIVLPRWNAAIFVHGCFWHRHAGCRYASMPKHNSAFWAQKFRENIDRDERIWREIETQGWRYLVIWECQLKKEPRFTLEKIAEEIRRSNPNEHQRRYSSTARLTWSCQSAPDPIFQKSSHAMRPRTFPGLPSS